MVNCILKILNLFNLLKDERNSDDLELNNCNNISPNKSKLEIINKNYLIKVSLILITGLSHGFIIGVLSCFL